MYNPTHFAENDQTILFELIRQFPLACIVMLRDGSLDANHIPLLLRTKADGTVVLVGHVARSNPIAKCVQAENCLVIFQAADHYISPAWYAAKKETGKVVPTWNYSVAHVQGKLQVIDEV
ncbi:MAG: FMN-binding negative transcriptional regulator, partial [Burkholderiales bacterium]|nr:FMN-binding negative transcriptional regulator [Burkholderiales bacterium]